MLGGNVNGEEARAGAEEENGGFEVGADGGVHGLRRCQAVSRLMYSMAYQGQGRKPALSGEELGVNVSEATVKGAADLKLVGGHVAKHEAGLNVLGPGVADVGGGLADGHLFDEEAAFGSDGLDVFFEASGEAEEQG